MKGAKMITACTLNQEDFKGIPVSVGDRPMLVDNLGYNLWRKYKWSVTCTNLFPHRHEKGKVIPFHRELLQLQGTRDVITFRNGNKFDCRLANLDTKSLHWYYDL